MSPARPDPSQLTRRERQIMDILYALGRGTAVEVHERLPDPPSYSAVRALLVKLEGKGHIEHKEQGPRYVYSPVVARSRARRSALRRVVDTFFDGSPLEAFNAMLDLSADELSPTELERLARIIDDARKRDS